MPRRPGDKEPHIVQLSAEALNSDGELSILPREERERLREEFKTPGSPTIEGDEWPRLQG
jgi:hypothetical protein